MTVKKDLLPKHQEGSLSSMPKEDNPMRKNKVGGPFSEFASQTSSPARGDDSGKFSGSIKVSSHFKSRANQRISFDIGGIFSSSLGPKQGGISGMTQEINLTAERDLEILQN